MYIIKYDECACIQFVGVHVWTMPMPFINKICFVICKVINRLLFVQTLCYFHIR